MGANHPLNVLTGTSNSLTVEGLNALGSLEQKIMCVFWKDPAQQLTGGQVYDILGDERRAARERGDEAGEPMAYTTIKTTMTRLQQKGALKILYTQGNQAAVYQCTCTAQEWTDRAVTRVVQQMLEVSPTAARAVLAQPVN